MSETATCRPYLSRFCVGHGVDIGFGGDAINQTCDTVDIKPELHPTHLCDARKLPMADDSYDYVFSSHCLEDFEDTADTLREWLRVIKPGGKLVLFLPDQPTYVAHCEANKVLPNQDHKYAGFGLTYVSSCLYIVGRCKIILYEWPCHYNPYSFALVARRV